MKKLYLFVVIAMFGNIVLAQDINDVKNLAVLGQNEKAKEAVDKFLLVEKNAKKAEGWFYKGYIYNQLSKDATKKPEEASDLKQIAFDALKKYREMDSNADLLKDQNNAPLFDIYVGYSSDLGVTAYTNKNVAAAFEGFKKGLEVHDYIVANNLTGANGFKFSALDTTLTLYAGITSGELKNTDVSASYYKKLTDANVGDPQYIDAYQVLADYYKTKKDHVAFADILAKGRKFYPTNEEYWMALEIEEAIDGVGKPEVFKKYEDLMSRHPANYTLPYNYSVELYHYIYSDKAKAGAVAEYKAKLVEVANKAIVIKSTVDINFLLANFLYNNSIDVSEEARKLKGPKPDDLKKKKELEAKATATMNESIPYAEAVETLFATLTKPKTSEKINYKQSLVILKNIYEVKKDAAKMAAYDKKIKEAE